MNRTAPVGLIVCLSMLNSTTLLAQRQMEHLGRGAVAVKQEDGRVFLNWRLLGTDPEAMAFNVYRATDGATPVKRNETPLTTITCFQDGCSSNNGSKSTPELCADLLGDWREEVVWRSSDNRELRIYSTTAPTEHRLPTLMHDPQYRLSVAWQNVAYNQPTQPRFYLGNRMSLLPKPRINTTRYRETVRTP